MYGSARRPVATEQQHEPPRRGISWSGFRFNFDDVPLIVGKSPTGARLCIGFIAGVCEISGPPDQPEIENIVLTAPILGQPSVDIPYARDCPAFAKQRWLWEMVVDSIQEACGSAIYDALSGAGPRLVAAE